jgi:hypothetical protein
MQIPAYCSDRHACKLGKGRGGVSVHIIETYKRAPQSLHASCNLCVLGQG